MRTALLLILLVIVGGVGVGSLIYKNNLEDSENARTHVLASLSQIKHIDSLINTQMLESRYGLRVDYDELAQLITQIKREVSELDTTLLVEPASVDNSIRIALDNIKEQLTLKIDVIENFKSHNSVLRNSIKYAPVLGDSIIEELSVTNNEAAQDLKVINNALYRWALYGSKKEATIIQDNSAVVIDLIPKVENSIALIEYSTHVTAVIEEQEKTQRYITNALAIPLVSTVGQLETVYAGYYMTVLKSLERDRLYVMGYALFALLVAVYLGVMLRKSYQALKGRDEYRSQQISVAYRHVGYADNHVGTVKGAFYSIKEILLFLDGIYLETKKQSHDPKKMSQLLSKAIKKYRHLDKQNTIDETDELLEKSNHNLEKASTLIKNLMAS